MNPKVKILVVGQLATNCYLVWEEKNQETLILDPGDEANYLTEEILRLGLKPKMIIATHAHFDHLLAGFELQLNFKIPFLMNQRDQPILKQMETSARYWLHLKNESPGPPPKPNRFLKNNDQIKLGKNIFKVINTPGHTPGSISLYCAKEKLLFSGDTLFANGVGRTDLPGSSPVQLIKSLEKLFKLPPETRVLPGHGASTKIGKEKNIDLSWLKKD